MKKLFATPKRVVLTSLCMVAVLAVIGTGAVFAMGLAAENNAIGKTNAENLALTDAGLDPAAASSPRTELDRDDGRYVYEVEFSADGVEYDYTINAADGAVIAKDIDKQRPKMQTKAQTQTQNKLVSLDAAKQAALSDASVSSGDVTYTKAQLDHDDGIQTYDIEFYTATTQYEYELNAATGAIVDKSIEVFPAAPSQQPAQGTYIGVDSAKSIVVSHAGFTLADVIFQKAKLENDDGHVEYEVEFYRDGIEYEYTINATSGAIIEYDSEHDD